MASVRRGSHPPIPAAPEPTLVDTALIQMKLCLNRADVLLSGISQINKESDYGTKDPVLYHIEKARKYYEKAILYARDVDWDAWEKNLKENEAHFKNIKENEASTVEKEKRIIRDNILYLKEIIKLKQDAEEGSFYCTQLATLHTSENMRFLKNAIAIFNGKKQVKIDATKLTSTIKELNTTLVSSPSNTIKLYLQHVLSEYEQARATHNNKFRSKVKASQKNETSEHTTIGGAIYTSFIAKTSSIANRFAKLASTIFSSFTNLNSRKISTAGKDKNNAGKSPPKNSRSTIQTRLAEQPGDQTISNLPPVNQAKNEKETLPLSVNVNLNRGDMLLKESKKTTDIKLKQSIARDALRHYKKARDHANSEEKKAMIDANIGMGHCHLVLELKEKAEQEFEKAKAVDSQLFESVQIDVCRNKMSNLNNILNNYIEKDAIESEVEAAQALINYLYYLDKMLVIKSRKTAGNVDLPDMSDHIGHLTKGKLGAILGQWMKENEFDQSSSILPPELYTAIDAILNPVVPTNLYNSRSRI